MPIKIFWDDEQKTVIRYEMYGRWTTQEFWEAYEEARAMINSVENEVNFIQIAMDKFSKGHIPNNFIPHLGSIYRNAHPRAGRTIVVPKAAGLMGQIWSRIITKSLPNILTKFDYADSLEEAREKLHQSQNMPQDK